MNVSLLTIIYFILILWIAISIIRTPRDIGAAWAWLFIVFISPVIGAILYLFTGRGLGEKKKYVLAQSQRAELEKIQHFSKTQGKTVTFYDSKEARDLDPSFAEFLDSLNQMPGTRYNQVHVITDGQNKLERLLADIKQAKHSIHLEYFAFVTDDTGKKILAALEERASTGVQVRLLYDAVGSLGTKKKDFEGLQRFGGEVKTFITSQRPLVKLRANYHDHRKIVVIDGKIGYIGGFNLADQYVKRTKKFGYWRDTHLRIDGAAASLLQIRFLMDWNVSVRESERLDYEKSYFYYDSGKQPIGKTAVHVVASGPNTQKEQIKQVFMKLLLSGKKRIWIQTPYFVPDGSILDALTIAARSGVDVRVMIPNKPDHPVIYRATQYYARRLIQAGVKVYVYHGGFLHAKTMVVDDTVAVVGSANQDIRSYKLNFEASAVLLDSVEVAKLGAIFERDLIECSEFTPELVSEMSSWLIFKQQLSRLLSPIL
ncbi:cardiolipin synthase [Enterococcus sp. LJL98]